MYICIYVYLRAHTHAHAHTYTYTYTYTRARAVGVCVAKSRRKKLQIQVDLQKMSFNTEILPATYAWGPLTDFRSRTQDTWLKSLSMRTCAQDFHALKNFTNLSWV